MERDMVVGMGEVLWDVFADGKEIGGAPANFAFHVSQFGLPSCVVSAVGDDALGRDILENFTTKGLGQLIAEVPYPTGTVFVEVDEAGIPHYEIKECVAWDNIPFSDSLERLAKQTRAVCFGSLAQRSAVSRATINKFLDAMPLDEDSLVVFDVNLRQSYYDKALLANSMERCNVLKINEEELEIVGSMFGLSDEDYAVVCRGLMDMFGIKLLILTCGERGSHVFTREFESFLPTPIVKVADTVGAGDSFTAAFIASILKGKSVEEAHRRAVRTSAYVCTQNGATPMLPRELTE